MYWPQYFANCEHFLVVFSECRDYQEGGNRASQEFFHMVLQ